MEYMTLYEAGPCHIVTLPFVIVCVIECVLIVYCSVTWKHNSISGRIGIIIVGCILLLVITSTIITYHESRQLYYKYTQGDYQKIEGVIENYTDGTEEKLSFPDRFSINEEEFIISTEPYWGYGYTVRQHEGNSLKNGVKCRIFYINKSGENVIMKLEIIPE